jgi:hypothetical protein
MSKSQLPPQAASSHSTDFNTQTLETTFCHSTKSWDLPDWQVTHEARDGGSLKLHFVLPIWLVLV